MSMWGDLMDGIRKGLQSFLEIQPPMIRSYHVWGDLDFAGNAIKNRLWYRGSANELEEFWKQVPGEASRRRFWAAVPTTGRDIEKIHVGLPALMADMLTDIVVTDLQQVDAGEGAVGEAWDEISEENDLYSLLSEACRDVLVIGDGAFRISIDEEVSKLPIIEFIPGDRCDFARKRGRLTSVTFKTREEGYDLFEEYGRGYIRNYCRVGDEERTPAQVGLDMPERIEWSGDYMMAVPLQFFPSSMFEGRGGSIYDARSDNFDALDECWSQWMDALRKARTKEYVPEALIPRDPKTGAPIAPSPFDNAYLRVEGTMAEGVSNRVEVVQPAIPYAGYLSTYVNALDLCLTGLISPSTLGIDVKKLDNAEAQREKEKATLYTRNKMVTSLQQAIPRLVRASVNAWQTLNRMALTDDEVDVQFGEYANPSFESTVETVGRAKLQGIMSIDACVEELYGDTRDREWKEQEVRRLKAEQGMVEMDQPTVGVTWEELLEPEEA